MKLRGKVFGRGISQGGCFNEGGTEDSCETSFGWNCFTVSSCLFTLLLLFFSFMPTSPSSSLFLSLITFPPPPPSPLFLSLPLNYGSGGAVAYVRAEAASAKQLSNALGRHLPVAGQVREKPFSFIEC